MTKTEEWTEGIDALIKMLAPIAPHITEELWQRSGHAGFVHEQGWPMFEEAALAKDSVVIAVQVNGKLRGQVEVAAEADKTTVIAAAKAEPNVARYLGGEIVREIVVPGKLVNLVVKS